MRYSNPYIQQTATRIPILCGLLFVFFSVVWLLLLQSNLLAFTQRVSSNGTAPWHPWFVTIFITLLCTCLGAVLTFFLRELPMRLRSLAWFPSYLLLGMLTHFSYHQFGDNGSVNWGIVLFWLILYCLFIFSAMQFHDTSGENDTPESYVWPNVLTTVLMVCATMTIANTDRSLHYTLSASKALADNDIPEVLRIAECDLHPSHSLTAITTHALARQGELGDRLFYYPQLYGSEGLLPQQADSILFSNTPLAVGHHLGYCKGDNISALRFLQLAYILRGDTHSHTRDYLLCAYLLERKLDDFAQLVVATDSISDMLPLHYREALILYQHLRMHPITDLQDDLVDANYSDFLSLKSSVSDIRQQRMLCKNMYGNTYWTYFYFQ